MMADRGAQTARHRRVRTQTHRRDGQLRGAHDGLPSHTTENARSGASRVGPSRSRAARPSRRRHGHQASQRIALQSSEERFRMLAEGVPNHLLFLDRDLRILFANDVFLEASGWSTDNRRRPPHLRDHGCRALPGAPALLRARSRGRDRELRVDGRGRQRSGLLSLLVPAELRSRRARCAASSRWRPISRSGAKWSSSSKPNRPSSSARTRISSNSPMSHRTT